MILESLVTIHRFPHRKINLMQVCNIWLQPSLLGMSLSCDHNNTLIKLMFFHLIGAAVSSASDLAGASYKPQVGKVLNF